MTGNLLARGNVVLRAPAAGDVEARLAVGYNRDYVRLVGGELPAVDPPYTREDAEGWVRMVGEQEHSWVVDVDGRCVGSARLHSLRPLERRARYAVGIFDPAYWGRGVGLIATRLVLGYGFGMLALHRIDLRVLAFNTRAIAMYEKAGFVVEGVEREGALLNGRWESDVWMSMLEDEYRRGRKYE